jgi:hypothetical protein
MKTNVELMHTPDCVIADSVGLDKVQGHMERSLLEKQWLTV